MILTAEPARLLAQIAPWHLTAPKCGGHDCTPPAVALRSATGKGNGRLNILVVGQGRDAVLGEKLPVPFDGGLPLARSGRRLRLCDADLHEAIRPHPLLSSQEFADRALRNDALVMDTPERGLGRSMLGTGAKKGQTLVRTGVAGERWFHAVVAELGEDVGDREARRRHGNLGSMRRKIVLSLGSVGSRRNHLSPETRAEIANRRFLGVNSCLGTPSLLSEVG